MSLEAKIEELSRSVTLLTGDVQLLTAALKPFLEHLAANRDSPAPVVRGNSQPIGETNMILEAKIELLTAAVEALTLTLSERTSVRPIVEPSFTEQISAVTAEYVREKAVDQLKAGNESSTPASGAQSEPEQKKSFTYDDVKRATNALSAAKGKEVTIAALAHFGVTRATQLTEAQWEDYIMYCGART